MDDINLATSATRLAVEFLTLWMEPDRQGAADHISRVLNDPHGPARDSVIVGHLNLSMLLVLELARARGAEDGDKLMERAGEFLRNLSRSLPE